MESSTRRRILIIDGFNVLRSGSRYECIVAPNPDWDHDAFNRAREALINDVASYAGRDCDATIVFDGGGNVESTGESLSVGGVRVVFSPAGFSADTVVEKLAREGRNAGYEVMVVSSDASIQDTVFGLGVDRMSAAGFSREIERHYEEARLDEMPQVSEKRTIEGRLDAKTIERLRALRDSL